MLTEWVTEISLPRRGLRACMHLCTSGNVTCAPGTIGCACALPTGYGVSNAGNVLMSDDCSGVPLAFKSWTATQRSPGWWQFASAADGTCLTVNTGDYIGIWYGCECSNRVQFVSACTTPALRPALVFPGLCSACAA